VSADQRPGRPFVSIERKTQEVDASVSIAKRATHDHPMAVNHTLFGLMPPSALTVSVASARFTGSGPFIGTATFRSGAPGVVDANGFLTGPLTANFRGLGRVAALGASPVPGHLG
jgi:hypothetical protein